MEWLIAVVLIIFSIVVVCSVVGILCYSKSNRIKDENEAITILRKQRDNDWEDCKSKRVATAISLKSERNNLLDKIDKIDKIDKKRDRPDILNKLIGSIRSN